MYNGHSNNGQWMDTQIKDKHLDTRNIQILEQSTLDTQSIQTQHPPRHLKQPWSTKQHFKTSK
jgi:hypothetical protein